MNNNQRELTMDECDILLTLKNAKDDQVDEMFDGIIGEGGWVLKAIKKRFEHHKLEVDKRTMIMVLSHGDGVVGRCAKYVDDVVVICRERNLNKVTFEDYQNKVYPWGIPEF